ncbi:EVE domain-containing protein [Candidatus Contubernalis alkaliaceticus]|uniref:EVE domain-containing protein n=1 Tax=Candidatus Contubernalis alkaliaceticus TaxID=338645 RepID=UPI001F4C177C|nr:EVE domain-containing protein [Candidatus Contubernalis alkalaceticus]UNC91060.1 EVE domain-containing protein [Candidatus Contubernalis alkalaceticus]
MQTYWLLKTEPGEYSWEDMLQEKKVVWDGVKAPAALKNLSRMKVNDLAFIYHTGSERAVVGIARVVKNPYQDPSESDPRRLVIDLVPFEHVNRPVTLRRIKDSSLFPDWELVRQARLSVVPVSRQQWDKVLEWAL